MPLDKQTMAAVMERQGSQYAPQRDHPFQGGASSAESGGAHRQEQKNLEGIECFEAAQQSAQRRIAWQGQVGGGSMWVGPTSGGNPDAMEDDGLVVESPDKAAGCSTGKATTDELLAALGLSEGGSVA